jgi:hypothetical protein
MRELNWGVYGLLQVTGRTVSETKLDKLVNIKGNGSTPEDFTKTHRKAAEGKVYQCKGWKDQYRVAPCSRYNSVKLILTDLLPRH